MKKDIKNKEDIALLVNTFYSRVMNDEVIGYIFRETPGFSFETHIPIMVSFWETLLFGTAGYKGNTMLKHIDLNKIIPLKEEHFNRWLQLWEETNSSLFEGAKAEEAITRAKNVASLMQFKLGITR